MKSISLPNSQVTQQTGISAQGVRDLLERKKSEVLTLLSSLYSKTSTLQMMLPLDGLLHFRKSWSLQMLKSENFTKRERAVASDSIY